MQGIGVAFVGHDEPASFGKRRRRLLASAYVVDHGGMVFGAGDVEVPAKKANEPGVSDASSEAVDSHSSQPHGMRELEKVADWSAPAYAVVFGNVHDVAESLLQSLFDQLPVNGRRVIVPGVDGVAVHCF